MLASTPRTLAALADAHDEHMAIVRSADADKIECIEFQEVIQRSLGWVSGVRIVAAGNQI